MIGLALHLPSFVVAFGLVVVAAPDAATVADAAKVLDLATYPLPPGGKSVESRRVAELHALAKGTTREVYAFQKKTLESKGWKELPGGNVADDSASGAFGKDGFTISVTAYPSYGEQNKGYIDVLLRNLGNVEAKKLPVPPDAKLLYSFPATTAYVTEQPVAETAAAVRKLLAAQGWEPYGTAGDAQYFKKNAVKVSARVLSAPGQGGKTVIDVSTEQLSADLPAPPETLRASYSDSNKTLSFDVAAKSETLVAFYREKLGKGGWKPTTDAPVKDRFEEFLIFRNAKGDLLELTTQEVEGKLRATLKHQSAAEVAEEGERAKAAAEKKAKMQAKEAPAAAAKVVASIAVPAGAKDVKQDKDGLRFTMGANKAKAAVEAVRADLLKDGWKEQVATLDALAGVVSLAKGQGSLTIQYTDTGFTPAEVSISGSGAQVETRKGK